MHSLSKISKRHELPIALALPYEAFVRLYRKSIFRRSVRTLFRPQQPEQWCFVAGCYNAGTTIVKDCIAMHPAVSTLPIEGDILTDHLSNYEEGGWSRCMFGNRESIANDQAAGGVSAEALCRDWAPWMRAKGMFMDKSISHSCRLAHLAHEFPSARFVVVTREPRAVVAGIKKRSRPQGIARERIGSDTYSDDLLLKQWAYLYRTIVDTADWDRTLIVAYESMLSRPVETLQSIYEFLGLHAEEVCFVAGELVMGKRRLSIRSDQNVAGQEIQSKQHLQDQIRAIEDHRYQ